MKKVTGYHAGPADHVYPVTFFIQRRADKKMCVALWNKKNRSNIKQFRDL
jgi:hypothetical protein